MVPVRIHGSKPAGLADIAKTIGLLEEGVEVVTCEHPHDQHDVTMSSGSGSWF